MTKNSFLKHAIVSSAITLAAIVAILIFCAAMYIRYSPPSENNTSIQRDTVTSVYLNQGVVVEMSSGDMLYLMPGRRIQKYFSEIGYDLHQLQKLLTGKIVEYSRLTHLPWVIEINAGEVTINNQTLIEKMIVESRIGLVVLGLIMLPWPVYGNVLYLKGKYKLYKNAQKKQEIKLRNQHRNTK